MSVKLFIMKILSITSNLLLFLFTCFVLLTDGITKEAGYMIFTLLLLLVPILNAVLLFRDRTRPLYVKLVAVISNIALIGFACWAIMDQHPHPKESGVIAYAVLILLTPILSLIAILAGRANKA